MFKSCLKGRLRYTECSLTSIVYVYKALLLQGTNSVTMKPFRVELMALRTSGNYFKIIHLYHQILLSVFEQELKSSRGCIRRLNQYEKKLKHSYLRRNLLLPFCCKVRHSVDHPYSLLGGPQSKSVSRYEAVYFCTCRHPPSDTPSL